MSTPRLRGLFRVCGFVVIHSGRTGAPPPQAALDTMDRAIRHRGPDAHHQAQAGPVSFGHRRLAIIDLVGGAQPMASACGRYHLAYNGEIYNFRDVRAELEKLGRSFRDHSDTEVLLQAWAEWGEACLAKLNGMFALALYDKARDTLYLARDRFGEKPLYWSQTSIGFVAASELKALVAAGLVEKRLDPVSLYSFFTLGYVAGDRSIFAGASRLAPGSLLMFSPATGIEIRRWWQPPLPTEDIADASAAATRSLDILHDSVRLRMIADVPFGFFLSGGVDSSAIVALAAEQRSDTLRTFSIGFDDRSIDERPHARFVAERFGTEHREFVVTPQNLDVLEEIAWHADEPFADQAVLPTWFLAKMTRDHVKVALSGDGGDEIFAGYDIYRAHGLSERVRSVPAPLRRLAVAGLQASAPFGDSARRLKLARNIEDVSLPPLKRFIAKQQQIFRREFFASVSPLLAPVAVEETDRLLFSALMRESAHPLGALAWWQQTCSLPDDMLHKVDRMSMAHSLEVRTPFLDHRLAELLNRTAFAAKLAGGRQKFILRSALAGYFPADFLWRPKQGFVVPLQRWFKGDLDSLVRTLLLAPGAHVQNIISASAIERIAGEHARGERMRDGALWALVMFEHWCRVNGLGTEGLLDAA